MFNPIPFDFFSFYILFIRENTNLSQREIINVLFAPTLSSGSGSYDQGPGSLMIRGLRPLSAPIRQLYITSSIDVLGNRIVSLRLKREKDKVSFFIWLLNSDLLLLNNDGQKDHIIKTLSDVNNSTIQIAHLLQVSAQVLPEKNRNHFDLHNQKEVGKLRIETLDTYEKLYRDFDISLRTYKSLLQALDSYDKSLKYFMLLFALYCRENSVKSCKVIDVIDLAKKHKVYPLNIISNQEIIGLITSLSYYGYLFDVAPQKAEPQKDPPKKPKGKADSPDIPIQDYEISFIDPRHLELFGSKEVLRLQLQEECSIDKQIETTYSSLH